MWIFFAFASRFFWAGGNAMDQVLSRMHRKHEAFSAMALSFSVQAPFGVAALLLGGWPPHDKTFLFWLAVGAAADFIAYLPYYTSMQQEEARNITPFLEMTPVFLTVLAFIFRGEILAPVQIAGGIIVIACGFLFSWDFKSGMVKARIFGLVALCSFFFAVNQFAVRMVSDSADMWTVTGCFLLGQTAMGVLLLAVRPQVRASVREALARTHGRSALLALGEAGLCFLGLLSLIAAFRLAPSTGHVAGLSGTQPFLSFFLAVILGRVLPGHFEKVVFDRETKLKLLLLLGLLLGVWLLAQH